MSFNPRVSIVIPVYNGSNYLREAIDSALAQKYENIEVIVVNDGSNDRGATDEVARSYGSKIRYLVKENGGVASALNLAIDYMTGDYFSWLSHDDIYDPDKIAKQIAAVGALKGNTVIVASNVAIIDEKGQKIKSNKISHRANRSIRCFLATDTDTGLNGCSLLIPKGLFLKGGAFNPGLKATQDYDLWFRLSYYARFQILEEELVKSRVHIQQCSRTMGMQPTLEADSLHAMMLSQISMAEMRDFLDGDIKYVLNAYRVYLNAGYRKTAARLYAIIVKLLVHMKELDKATHFFVDGLLELEGNTRKKARRSVHTICTVYPANRKPTILVYCNVWFKGGIERVMLLLLTALKHKYNFILVSHASHENLEGFAIPDDICHIVIRQELISDIPHVLLMIASLSETSLVIVNPNIRTDVLSIYPVLKDCGLKTIACNHYYYFLPTWASWLYPVMAERLSYLADANVACWLTTFSGNAYALHNSNAAIMPNPNTFSSLEGAYPPSGNIILCVGRFYDAIKRLDRVLIVFKEILSIKSDAQLVLVGGYNLDLHIPTSSPETIGELLKRLDFPCGSVVFAGEQDSVDVFYRKATVLIMPSDNEGFSLALTEAGSHGIPSVIFDIPGLDDIITDGVNGFVVAQDDVKGMAKKVVELLTNTTLRLSMGQNACNMSKRFEREVICNRWDNLIHSVLSIGNAQELEGRLKEQFMVLPKDMQRFARTIAMEYEKGIRSVLKQQQQQPLVGEHESLIQEHQVLVQAYQNLQQSRALVLGRKLKEHPLLMKMAAMIYTLLAVPHRIFRGK